MKGGLVCFFFFLFFFYLFQPLSQIPSSARKMSGQGHVWQCEGFCSELSICLHCLSPLCCGPQQMELHCGSLGLCTNRMVLFVLFFLWVTFSLPLPFLGPATKQMKPMLLVMAFEEFPCSPRSLFYLLSFYSLLFRPYESSTSLGFVLPIAVHRCYDPTFLSFTWYPPSCWSLYEAISEHHGIIIRWAIFSFSMPLILAIWSTIFTCSLKIAWRCLWLKCGLFTFLDQTRQSSPWQSSCIFSF